MVKYCWGRDNPGFRQAFTTMFFPDASAAQQAWFNEVQKATATPGNAAHSLAASLHVDVVHLAPHVAVPTLVVHSGEDAMVPFESGRQLARKIPGARMVSLPSRNHIPLEPEAAWPQVLEEIYAFLGGGSGLVGLQTSISIRHECRCTISVGVTHASPVSQFAEPPARRTGPTEMYVLPMRLW